MDRSMVFVCLLSLGLLFSVGAAADETYDSAKSRIDTDHRTAIEACEKLVDGNDATTAETTEEKQRNEMAALAFHHSTNAKAVCVAKANGDRSIALAELAYQYTGNEADRVKLTDARRDAAESIAKAACAEKPQDLQKGCEAEEADRIEAEGDPG